MRTQRPQNALDVGVRTQRPTHLPLATVELRYKVFKTLVEENQTLIYHFQTYTVISDKITHVYTENMIFLAHILQGP